VENAIRHGLMKKVRGGTLRIEIDARAPDAVIVAVIDDGVGIEEERIGPLLEGAGEGGIGLYNTHKRLLHMFGQGLLIRRNPEGGTEIRMRIPK
jgi:sensor histidine kinase YesM